MENTSYVFRHVSGLSEDTQSKLIDSPIIALDTESTGVDPVEDVMLGLSMANRDDCGYYFLTGDNSIPINHISDPNIIKLAHNAKFEYIMLKKAGINTSNYYDTMIAAHLCGDHRLKLKELCALHLLRHVDDFDEAGKKIADMTIQEAAQYSIPHSIATWALWHGFEGKYSTGEKLTWKGYDRSLREIGSATVFKEIEMPIIPYIAEMELNGTMIDTKALTDIGGEFTKKRVHLSKALDSLSNTTGTNWDSPDQVSRILFEKLNLPHGKKTKAGKRYATDAKTIEALADTHPIISLLLLYRHYGKIVGTYVDGIMERLQDGRIHTNFNQTGTDTSRLSSTDPNLQNIPARDAEGRRIRAAFVASPGNILIKGDMSQIELRLMAHFSQDPVMLNAYWNNEDLHLKTAMELFNDAAKRFYGKTMNFSVGYGGGVDLVAQQTGRPRSEAAEWFVKYWKTYHVLYEWIEKTHDWCAQERCAYTMFGRRRLLPDFDNPKMFHHAEKQAVSTIVQGTAAEILKVGIIRLWKEICGSDILPILQVHDELVLDCPIKYKEDAISAMAKALTFYKGSDQLPMGKQLLLDIPIDISTGENWRDQEKVDLKRYLNG